MVQTQFEFILPAGYVDEQGNLQRHGVMRLATALDEVEPFSDPRVRANEAYLGIVLLSRVVLRLGNISPVGTAIIERLFSLDYTYLQELYLQANGSSSRLTLANNPIIETECPACGTRFTLDLSQLEEEPVG